MEIEELNVEQLVEQDEFDKIPGFSHGAWRKRIETDVSDSLSLSCLVRGRNRCKYFNQPLTNVNAKSDYPLQDDDDQFWWWGLCDPLPPRFATIGTQTDFRESEAQTDPWDPPYRIRSSSFPPQVLQISSLRYGSGLPIGYDELEFVSQARKRWEFEKFLPPISFDETQMKKRHEMITKQKVREINYIKSRIKIAHERKLTLRTSALQVQMEERERKKRGVLTQIYENKKIELKEKAWKLRETLAKNLRTLAKKQSVSTKKSVSAVNDSERSLEICVSDSALVAKNDASSAPEHFYLQSSQGLVNLERWLWEEQKIVMEPEIYGPKREARPSRLEKIIEQAEKELMKQRSLKASQGMIEVTHMRDKAPATSVVAAKLVAPQEADDREWSSVILQKLLRGRALHKEVMEVVHTYRGLMQELRKVQPISSEEHATLEEKRRNCAMQYLEAKQKSEQVSLREEVLSRFEGEVISKALNVKGKTLDRYTCWVEVDNFVRQANDVRRRREAEEAGRRQKEIIDQRKLQEMFDEIQSKTDDSAD